MPEDWSRALCVVAHPDDLEYGASSAVARWTSQGKQVTYLLATRGEAGIDSMPPHVAGPRREAEERAGAAEVGVEVVEFLGLTDGVVEPGLPLRREIARAIRRHKPEVVISGNFRLTWGGAAFNMADHRVVGEATLDASRDAGNRWIFPELVEGGFDPWPGVRLVAFSGSPEPTHGVDITGFVDRGIASLQAHEAYLSNLGGEAFDPAAFLVGQADTCGPRLGVAQAALFEVFEL
jgi:LmbE family N-acetylglucosaminyl deacetylase